MFTKQILSNVKDPMWRFKSFVYIRQANKLLNIANTPFMTAPWLRIGLSVMPWSCIDLLYKINQKGLQKICSKQTIITFLAFLIFTWKTYNYLIAVWLMKHILYKVVLLVHSACWFRAVNNLFVVQCLCAFSQCNHTHSLLWGHFLEASEIAVTLLGNLSLFLFSYLGF